jgi:hypothetical protein
MSYDTNADANISVATVCGNEVRIYAPYEGRSRRRLESILGGFSSPGAARLYAQQFDEREREARARRQAVRSA